MITDDDCKKIRLANRKKAKPRKAWWKTGGINHDGFSKHQPVDPVQRALAIIAQNNFIRERTQDYGN